MNITRRNAIGLLATTAALERKAAAQQAGAQRHIQGIQDLGLFRVLGQPNLNLTVDRQKAARYQINVADVQDAVQTAIGGNAVSHVLQASSAMIW